MAIAIPVEYSRNIDDEQASILLLHVMYILPSATAVVRYLLVVADELTGGMIHANQSYACNVRYVRHQKILWVR